MSIIKKSLEKYFIKCEDCGKEEELACYKDGEDRTKCSSCEVKAKEVQNEKEFYEDTDCFMEAKIIGLKRQGENSIERITIKTKKDELYEIRPGSMELLICEAHRTTSGGLRD